MEELSMEGLGIGQLAKRGGVGMDTGRHYERNGLLTPHARRASGYRSYGGLELAKLIAACPGHSRAAECSILKALTDEDVT
jgi:DNA-binding transcriptional MerR regulator